MKLPEFARKSVFLFVATNTGSVIQYVFQAVMMRMLTGPQFALMNTLFNMMSLLGVPGTAMQLDLARRTAWGTTVPGSAPGSRMVFSALFRMTPYFLAVVLGLFLLRHALADFFNTTDPWTVALAGMAALVMIMGTVTLGFFSGMQWFFLLGVLGLGMALLRVLLGWLLAHLGMGAGAGVVATGAIGLLPIICLGVLIRRFRGEKRAPPMGTTGEGVFRLAVLVIGVNAVLTNMDLLLVKHYFSEEEAARFATAGIFGRAMIFFLGPMGMALVPLSTVQTTRANEGQNQMLWQCLKLCLLLGIIAAIAGGFLADVALVIMKGHELPDGVPLLRQYLWAMLPFALVTIVMNHVLAVKSWQLAWQAVAMSALYPLGVVCWHRSLEDVLMVNFISGNLILLVLLWQLRQEERVSPHRRRS